MKQLVIALLLLASFAHAQAIRVGAAISLKDALEPIAKTYTEQTGQAVTFTFASSGQIMAQIKSGADIDVFISAANKQVDDLSKEKLVIDKTRRVIAGNTLVLVVPKDSANPPQDFSALRDESVKRIAIGEPQSVPAGQYAMQVLTSLKLVDAVKPKLVYGTNVRQVLAYVERGEVSAAIVYATDAIISGDKVRVVSTASADTHEPIVYPGIVVQASANTEAAGKFLDYLGTDRVRVALAAQGFAPATQPADAPKP